MPADHPVIIVGGGWAGIAAAAELASHQQPVVLLESARHLGGRARSVNLDDLEADNGQHLLLGAYRETLRLMHTVGISEPDVLLRQPLAFTWLRRGDSPVRLRTIKLPAPLHLLAALLFTSGLTPSERLAAIRFSHAMQRRHFILDTDCSVHELLHRHRQPAAVITALWEPLCLGALNTRIDEASAQIFLRTLSDSFQHARRDSDLLLTRRPLDALLPGPAAAFIERLDGRILLSQRVTGLTIKDGCIAGVSTTDRQYHCSRLILATPHAITRQLLLPHPALRPIASRLEHITDRPICTVYLQFPEQTRLDACLLGSLGTLSQWIFDRGIYGQHGLMAVVISGDGAHMQWDNTTLAERITQELADHFPHWPTPLSVRVIREKRATFASTMDINRHRPQARTPVDGLWLAGDYTDVDLPATLEGAVRSGLRCARDIMAENPQG